MEMEPCSKREIIEDRNAKRIAGNAMLNESEKGVRTATPRSGWTFLSNHGHVVIALTLDPSARIRDLAQIVGITERAISQILADLVGEGIIERERSGRRNVYRINTDRPLRHPVESHRRVSDIVRLAKREAIHELGP